MSSLIQTVQKHLNAPTILGVLHILSTINWWFVFVKEREMLAVPIIIPLCFSLWLIALGVGLIQRKESARRGSLIYAWVSLLVSILSIALYVGEVVNGFFFLPGGALFYPLVVLYFLTRDKTKALFGVQKAS